MKSSAFRISVVTVCLIGAAVYLGVASRAEVLPPHQALAQVPMTIDQWRGQREADFSPEILKVLGVDDYIIRSYYRANALPIGLYAGFYHSQRQGDTIHSPLNCLPGAGWIPLEQGHKTIVVQGAPGFDGGAGPIEVNRVVIGKGLDRQLVLYWYQSHGRVVASEYWGKIYTVLDSVRYNRTDAAMVRVIAPIPEGASPEQADEAATAFVKALFPVLRPHIPS